MTEQYIFFCTNVGNEKLLKEEIRVFYPELTLSYSRKGFVTFKNKGIQYRMNSIAQLDVAFATRAGICLGKAKPEGIVEAVKKSCEEIEINYDKCVIHSFSVNTDAVLEAGELFQREVNEHSPINKNVIDLITLGENEVWYGVHRVGKSTTHFPNANPEVELPESSPSRAYLKIAEAVKLFNIHMDRKDMWLDFGSAPGGASHFLLENGCKVWGIDPAKMDESIMEHPRYKHLSTPIQDLSQEDIPAREVQWVNADLNLNPKQAIKEVLRLIKKYNFNVKGIIFSIQVIKMDHVKNIENFEDHFYDWGFETVISRQIPSQKQEYLIIAKKRN